MWNSCEEKLPEMIRSIYDFIDQEKSSEYFAASAKNRTYHLAYLYQDCNYEHPTWIDIQGNKLNDITHWKELKDD